MYVNETAIAFVIQYTRRTFDLDLSHVKVSQYFFRHKWTYVHNERCSLLVYERRRITDFYNLSSNWRFKLLNAASELTLKDNSTNGWFFIATKNDE